jgi:hypothetical protein
MESVSPQLRLIMAIKFGFQNNVSLRQSLIAFIQQPPHDKFQMILRSWFRSLEVNKKAAEMPKIDFLTQILLYTLEKGLENQPILEMLNQLEEEVIMRDEIFLQRQIALLPMKSLIPLLLLQVPALMIMIFIPMLGMIRF